MTEIIEAYVVLRENGSPKQNVRPRVFAVFPSVERALLELKGEIVPCRITYKVPDDAKVRSSCQRSSISRRAPVFSRWIVLRRATGTEPRPEITFPRRQSCGGTYQGCAQRDRPRSSVDARLWIYKIMPQSMSRQSLKDRLAAYFRRRHSTWIASGDLQRIVMQAISYTPQNLGRRLRELENEGVLEAE